MRTRWAAAFLVVGIAAALSRPTAQQATEAEWLSYGGDKGSTKYSPLDQINGTNVGRLRIARRRPAVAMELLAQYPELRYSNAFRSTPLMLGGVLYASNSIGLVEAFDPGTARPNGYRRCRRRRAKGPPKGPPAAASRGGETTRARSAFSRRPLA
jgi:glucose dehydrogenase